MSRVFAAVASALLVLFANCVTANEGRAQQAYPTKPIQVARTAANRLSVSLQQPIVIENQPAANGSIAASHVARSPADGDTLMDSTMTINPHLYGISYNVFRDFTPISLIVRAPVFLIANSAVKANTGPEPISLAKASSGKLNYASAGVGTLLHMGMELLMPGLPTIAESGVPGYNVAPGSECSGLQTSQLP